MSLTAITIKNFQSHKNTTLKLHKGVNVLIGNTDCGKSAILRAVGWSILNKTDDRSFRSKWGGKTDVELTFDDGLSVSRVQDKSNAYYLYDPTSNIDEEYKAFKTDIPEDIVEALSMDSINIQSQFDTPFLLGKDYSSGDVAKLLNQIAGLSDIDDSVANISRQVRANRAEIATEESLIESLTAQSASFEYLDDMEDDVAALEALEEQYRKTSQNDFNLALLITDLERQKKELDELELFLKAEPECKAVSVLVSDLKVAEEHETVLQSLLSKLEKAQKEIEGINIFLEAEPDMEKAMALLKEEQAAAKEANDLSKLLSTIDRLDVMIEINSETLEKAEKTWIETFPNICPLCGGATP